MRKIKIKMNFKIIKFASAVNICSVALILCNPSFGHAQSKKQTLRPTAQNQFVEKSWAKEPESFLGIDFKKPLRAQNCPTKYISKNSQLVMMDFEALKNFDGVCIDTQDTTYKIQRGDSGKFKLYNLPNLGFTYYVYINFKEGVVTSFNIYLEQSDFHTLLSAFKERYGAPTTTQSQIFKTMTGAEFDAAVVGWKGKAISILMYERLGRVDESSVLITDTEDFQADLDSKRIQRSSEAQKF